MAASTSTIDLTTTTTTTNQEPAPLIVLTPGGVEPHMTCVISKLRCNLILIQAPFKLTKKLVYKMLGPYDKQVRSMYLMNDLDCLVDLVPYHDHVVDVVLSFTGPKAYQGFTNRVYFKRARDIIPYHMFEDYAYLLAHARQKHGSMNAAYLYPNEDWEPPKSWVIQFQLPAGQYEEEVGRAGMKYSHPPFQVYPAPELLD